MYVLTIDILSFYSTHLFYPIKPACIAYTELVTASLKCFVLGLLSRVFS